jgi:hypothetical protein
MVLLAGIAKFAVLLVMSRRPYAIYLSLLRHIPVSLPLNSLPAI